MNNWFFIPFLIVSSLILIGCQPQTDSPSSPSSIAEEKQGTTTKTGTVVESNGAFVLQVTGEPPLAIDSYAVDLQAYAGQTVTVTGQYSGDTLFVGEIQ